MPAAQVPRKLTFLYLANDVIQNSKRKGPEFTQDFAPVIVDAFKHVYRSVGAGCILTSVLFASVGIVQCGLRMIAFILLSYSEMVRRVAENSWAGCCPSGRSGLCTTAACWISCRRSYVSSLSVQVHQGPLVAPLGVQYSRKIIVQIERKEQKLPSARDAFSHL